MMSITVPCLAASNRLRYFRQEEDAYSPCLNFHANVVVMLIFLGKTINKSIKV